MTMEVKQDSSLKTVCLTSQVCDIKSPRWSDYKHLSTPDKFKLSVAGAATGSHILQGVGCNPTSSSRTAKHSMEGGERGIRKSC